MRKLLFVQFVALFFTAVFLQAQSGSEVQVEVSPNPVGRGDRFSVTIRVPVEDSSMVEVEEPGFDDAIILLRGPYVRPVNIPGSLGERITHTEITYIYRSDDTGRYEIGPYRVTGVERVYTTEPQLLEVGVYRNQQLIIPLELEWSLSSASAYVGQNVVSVLNALEQPEISMFEDISIGSPAEGFFQMAEGLGSINRIRRGGETLYEIPVASYIFTPSTSGRIALPQARVSYTHGQAVSGRPVIQVLPLPESVQESGAVGDFSLSAEVEKREVRQGDRVSLTVRVEGTGNLNYLRFPDVQLDGFTQLQVEESSDYIPTQNGYRGSRTYTYFLAAEEPGQKRLTVTSLNAVQPTSGRVYSTRSFTFSMDVIPEKRGAVEKQENSGFGFAPLQIDSMQTSEISTRFTQIASYGWMLPGPLLFLFFLLLRRKKLVLLGSLVFFLSFGAVEFSSERVEQTVENAYQAYHQKEFALAEALYLQAARERPEVPDLRYNAALCSFQKGDIGPAVLYTRTALTIQPMNETYAAFLDYISQEHGITTDIEPPFLFHPDLFLLLFTLFINGAGFMGIIYLFKQKNGYFIVSAFMLLASVALVIGLSYSVIQANQEVGVIVAKGESMPAVKKIPHTESSDAFSVKEGELVKIKGATAEFFFVETGLGRKGWILEENIISVPSLKKLSEQL
ncbi:MAG: BatD family protein [Spirochaetaceae bacterium]|nr:BatD family protein [Spirochaetaceae bacterium]MCF7947750.1 BatD family protein [Spirochaetia bacterium]MCF7950613.1 BatD family protein [Spirochaetaceae bacterium]